MSERDQTPYASGSRSVQDETTTYRAADDSWREQTTPGITPVRADDGPGGLFTGASHGATAVGPGTPGWSGQDPAATSPRYSTQPVAVRRGDPLAALLLLLAGIAAGVSLLLDWLPREDTRGWDVLKAAWDDVSDNGFGSLFDTGFWQPAAVFLGGAVLFVLGLLVLVPARAHRFLGLVGLLVSLAVAAGVLVPLSKNGWDLGEFRVGFYVAMGVAALGLLGSLKALLTGPKYGTTTRPA
jgi:hypothetical protein